MAANASATPSASLNACSSGTGPGASGWPSTNCVTSQIPVWDGDWGLSESPRSPADAGPSREGSGSTSSIAPGRCGDETARNSSNTRATVLRRYAYGYDPAGNRLYEQIDAGVTAWTYDNLNRLVTQAGGGVLQIGGLVNEPARVWINGREATVSATGQVLGALPVTVGTSAFSVTATDPSGNTIRVCSTHVVGPV